MKLVRNKPSKRQKREQRIKDALNKMQKPVNESFKEAIMTHESSLDSNNTDKTDINSLQEWERIAEVQTATQLPGEWKEIQLFCPHCDSDEHVYIYNDNNTIYCLDCNLEYDVRDLVDYDIESIMASDSIEENPEDLVTDDPQQVKQALEKLENTKEPVGFRYGQYGQSSFDWKKWCSHRPQHIIAGEGWGVYAGKKSDCRSSLNSFDIALNLTCTSVQFAHKIPIPQLSRYERIGENFIEIQLDWPDYGITNLPREFWVDLVKYLKDNHKRMIVFCEGGHGRTGTAIAVLLSLALGWQSKESIEWVRKNYCNNAIETSMQESYVHRMAQEVEVEQPKVTI